MLVAPSVTCQNRFPGDRVPVERGRAPDRAWRSTATPRPIFCRTVTMHGTGETVAPIARPAATIVVADLHP